MNNDVNREINDYVSDFIFHGYVKRKLKTVFKHFLDVVVIILPFIFIGILIHLPSLNHVREFMSNGDKLIFVMESSLTWFFLIISVALLHDYFRVFREKIFK